MMKYMNVFEKNEFILKHEHLHEHNTDTDMSTPLII